MKKIFYLLVLLATVACGTSKKTLVDNNYKNESDTEHITEVVVDETKSSNDSSIVKVQEVGHVITVDKTFTEMTEETVEEVEHADGTKTTTTNRKIYKTASEMERDEEYNRIVDSLSYYKEENRLLILGLDSLKQKSNVSLTEKKEVAKTRPISSTGILFILLTIGIIVAFGIYVYK